MRLHTQGRALALWLMLCPLYLGNLIGSGAWAYSAMDFQELELHHLSPVSQITPVLVREDTIEVDIDVPSADHLSHLQRRWWSLSDPNSRERLKAKAHSLARQGTSDTGALYSYLTRNVTLEVPPDALRFKLVLNRHQDSQPLIVNGVENLEGEPDDLADRMFPLVGTAYRQLTVAKNNKEVTTWAKVGWARMTAYNKTDGTLHIQGSWMVSDESRLGMPAATYHLTTAEQLVPSLNLSPGQVDEFRSKHSVANPSDLYVWRDLDYHRPLETPVDHMLDFESLSPAYDEIDLNNHMYKRSGSDNDTSGSGFSSGQNLYSTIGDPDGCPAKREVSLVGLVADCNFLQQFNSSETVRLHLIDMVNRASRLYEESFNITLGLKEVVLTNSTQCPAAGTDDEPWNYQCDTTKSEIGDRLAAITQWRGRRPNDGMAVWSLMTACSYSGIIGLSYVGMVCAAGSTVGGTNVVSHTNLDYKVFAHEVGHSFGAVHDCTSDTCSDGLDRTSGCCPLSRSTCSADGQYIMNPSTADSQEQFSPCTQGNICGAMGRRTTNSTCLLSNTGGINLFTTNVCGNGIVEEGEDCDCGGPEGCGNNSCCDPTTCKFKNNAVCDDQNDNCCQNCQFSSSQTVCRESSGPCDFTEYCTGNSTTCPADRYEDDGESCQLPGPQNSTTNGLTCMSGHCSSRDLQCQTLMGNNTIDGNGQTVNIARACSDDSSCQLSCVDPRYGDNVCFTTSQNYLDGTPCRGSGSCRSGRCVGGSGIGGGSGGSNGGGNGGFNPFSGDGNSYWRWIVIGVGIFVGVLILLGILGYCKRSRSAGIKPQAVPRPGGPPPAYRPPQGPPPQMQSNNPFASQWGGQQNAPVTNLPQYYPPPPAPPPQAFYHYNQRQSQTQDSQSRNGATYY